MLGKPVVDYVVNATLQSDKIDKTVVVCSEEYVDWFKERYAVDVCVGGSERNISFKTEWIISSRTIYAKRLWYLMQCVHLLQKELIDLYMDKLDEYEVVATCQK